MAVSLDLRKAHRHQRLGDLIAVLTHVNDERALVLLPALRKDAGWYIVAESASFLWGIDSSDPLMRADAMEHANEQSHIACQMLGLEPSKMNRAKVIAAITGLLPELIRMPSAPEQEFRPESYGQMILHADGKQIAGQDIRTEVAGVTYGR